MLDSRFITAMIAAATAEQNEMSAYLAGERQCER